ncbi:MAG TPA: C39 family peptidase [Streptosporangiaceae bacterium]
MPADSLPSRRNVLIAGGLGLAAAQVAPQAARAAGGRVPGNPPRDSRVQFHRWTTQQDFEAGRGDGIAVLSGSRLGVTISRPAGTTSYHDRYLKTTRTYEYSVWTSPVQPLGFGGNQLTAHWNADTPEGTFVKVEMRAIMDGAHSDWWTMGIWSRYDTELRRTSVNGQANAYGAIATDTWNARGTHRMQAYQLRLTLYRRPGLAAGPRVWQLGAVASYVPARTTVPASPPGPATGLTLTVTPYAENIHAGQYDQYGGGGEAWCSPSSTEMTTEYWGQRPTPAQLSWVDPSFQDPTVDYAARYTYDWGYGGTGNWPFNTAYAASYGLDAMVTRLNSLWELEVLIAAGYPVVTSQSFTKQELGIYTTNGHLWVVIGFTADGTGVIVNDPASNSDSNVYTIYDRREFEIVWLRTVYTKPDGRPGSGSGGICYIIKPHWRALPPAVDPRNPSWPGGEP